MPRHAVTCSRFKVSASVTVMFRRRKRFIILGFKQPRIPRSKTEAKQPVSSALHPLFRIPPPYSQFLLSSEPGSSRDHACAAIVFKRLLS